MSFKYFQKPNSENQDRVPPGQYLAKNFPVLSASLPPSFDLSQWWLKVWGLVKNQSFSCEVD